jgi:hypothetical protein
VADEQHLALRTAHEIPRPNPAIVRLETRDCAELRERAAQAQERLGGLPRAQLAAVRR